MHIDDMALNTPFLVQVLVAIAQKKRKYIKKLKPKNQSPSTIPVPLEPSKRSGSANDSGPDYPRSSLKKRKTPSDGDSHFDGNSLYPSTAEAGKFPQPFPSLADLNDRFKLELPGA